MRRNSEASIDRPRRRLNGRMVLIVIGGLFLFVLIFGRAIARFYVDYLWHESLGREDVFWGVLTAKLTLFGVFFAAFAVIAALNLWIADRAAPTAFPANVHPYVERFHDVFGHRLRIVRYGIAPIFALLLALPAVALLAGLVALPQRPRVRDRRCTVRCRRRLLRVPAPVPVIRVELVVHRVDRRAGADRGGPHPQRGRGVRVAGSRGPPGDQGPPRRVARDLGRREGGRLLARPLRHHQHRARDRAGGDLLGGEGPAPGDSAARS